MAKDVVCGMNVDERQASAKDLTSSYQGQTYYFCSGRCKEQFDQEPRRYAPPVVPPEQAQRQTGEQYLG
jgi:YHS domain-containing protein